MCRSGELKVPEDGGDPFNEVTQSHTLIGVANLYLDPLFYNARLTLILPGSGGQSGQTIFFKWLYL